MIVVKNLVKEYRLNDTVIRAVDGVSFHVNKGEIFGIIGLSGAGKSTLIRLLNRLEEPTSGEIVIDGDDMLTLSKNELLKKRKDIGMIFQSFNLFNQKTVYENIAYPLEIMKMKRDEIESKVDTLLDFIDLKTKKHAYPKEISGGQKQRVAIARALASNPAVLLCDEATSALDPTNTAQVLELLRRAVKDYKMTVVMITHQMEVAKDICDRIAVMENGKIIEEDTVERLFRSPKSKLTKSFIRSLREVDGEEIIKPEDFKGKILRLAYDKNTVNRPILSYCIKHFDLDINLISGSINRISTSDVGYMIVEVIGENKMIYELLDYLEKEGIGVEVL